MVGTHNRQLYHTTFHNSVHLFISMRWYGNVTLSNLSPLTQYIPYQFNNMEGKGNVGEAISVSFTLSDALRAAIEDDRYCSFKANKVRYLV